MSLQVLLPFPRDIVLLAGLPSIFRTTQRAAELKPFKVVWAGVPAGFVKNWGRQLGNLADFPVVCVDEKTSSKDLEDGKPLLVISDEGTPHPEALKEFLKHARKTGASARWVFTGKTVAAYQPSPVLSGKPASELARCLLSADGAAVAARAGDWHSADDPFFVARAEKAVYAGLGKENDGFIARWDRVLSASLSRLIVKTPVTPNEITTASLLIGMVGSVLIGTGVYGWQAAGALLLWSCCILDGCDGEVARLKLLSSKAGATYDVAADNLAHLAAFAGIAVGVHRSRPDLAWFWPGALLLSGVAACMFSVWWLILRRPDDDRSSLELFVERVASRDYVYLVLLLVLIGKLHWFLWAAAAGSHAFNLALWMLKAPRNAGRQPLPPAPKLS